MHRRWKRRVVALADVKPGGRALDLCCGTGDIAFALAARGAEVTGVDFSEAMLEVAEKRKAESGKAETGGGTEHRTLNLEPRTSNGGKGETGNPTFMQGDAM